ncbi:PREDICTED: podoplanin isoform X2 [Gekko japonicus]|uniref:Podoplanin isoform X2 n=1 Tax=Gekko japonicus TaxID=146911 RepID=A0ABM1JK32_GEKJA|nr:PREDICTED: podoplanin isoform X2 [Gekko japonicus]
MFLQMPLLLLLIGSVSFQGFAEEASTVLLEDETATGDSDGSGPPTPLPTKLQDTSDTVAFEELMTTESAVSPSEDSDNSTKPEVPESSEDGLETATLVGIIVGIVVAIGVVTGIIITVAKKMSGRP